MHDKYLAKVRNKLIITNSHETRDDFTHAQTVRTRPLPVSRPGNKASELLVTLALGN